MFSNKLEKIGFCTLTVCEHKVVKSCRQWFTLPSGVDAAAWWERDCDGVEASKEEVCV